MDIYYEWYSLISSTLRSVTLKKEKEEENRLEKHLEQPPQKAQEEEERYTFWF